MSRKLHNNARTARTACRKCSLFVLYGFFSRHGTGDKTGQPRVLGTKENGLTGRPGGVCRKGLSTALFYALLRRRQGTG